MPGCSYAGLHLASVPGLDELSPASTDRVPDLRVAVETTPLQLPSSWINHWISDDEITLSLGRIEGRHVLRSGDGKLFQFNRSNRTVTCQSPLDASARHQLLDHVLPRVLDDVGHLMMHGSAIDTPSGAIMFVGDSGLGKSTLAGSFQSVGADLLSDDCMRLAPGPEKSVSCTPTYRSLRLWPDSITKLMAATPSEPMSANHGKRRVRLPDAGPEPDSKAVTAICVLTPPPSGFSGVELNDLAPSRAVALLLAQCFRLDPTDAEATKRAFERVADVVERVPVIELIYDRSYDRLSELRDAVLQLSTPDGSAPIRPA